MNIVKNQFVDGCRWGGHFAKNTCELSHEFMHIGKHQFANGCRGVDICQKICHLHHEFFEDDTGDGGGDLTMEELLEYCEREGLSQLYKPLIVETFLLIKTSYL